MLGLNSARLCAEGKGMPGSSQRKRVLLLDTTGVPEGALVGMTVGSTAHGTQERTEGRETRAGGVWRCISRA